MGVTRKYVYSRELYVRAQDNAMNKTSLNRKKNIYILLLSLLLLCTGITIMVQYSTFGW